MYVVISIDVGVVIVKFDYINRSLLKDFFINWYQLFLVVSFDFFYVGGIGMVDSIMMQKYYSVFMYFFVNMYGGFIYKLVNFSINDWVDGI